MVPGGMKWERLLLFAFWRSLEKEDPESQLGRANPRGRHLNLRRVLDSDHSLAWTGYQLSAPHSPQAPDSCGLCLDAEIRRGGDPGTTLARLRRPLSKHTGPLGMGQIWIFSIIDFPAVFRFFCCCFYMTGFCNNIINTQKTN